MLNSNRFSFIDVVIATAVLIVVVPAVILIVTRGGGGQEFGSVGAKVSGTVGK